MAKLAVERASARSLKRRITDSLTYREVAAMWTRDVPIPGKGEQVPCRYGKSVEVEDGRTWRIVAFLAVLIAKGNSRDLCKGAFPAHRGGDLQHRFFRLRKSDDIRTSFKKTP